MCTNYLGIKLEPALQPRVRIQNRPHNCKTGHFTSWKEREFLRNVQKWKMFAQSVQSYRLSILNMQICDVLVAVVDVVAKAPYSWQRVQGVPMLTSFRTREFGMRLRKFTFCHDRLIKCRCPIMMVKTSLVLVVREFL